MSNETFAATQRSVNPLLKTYRYLRSLATWEAEGLCQAIEKWSREPEYRKGA